MTIEDYHIHSKYSFDGNMSFEEIVQESIKKNLSEIAVTDHIELAAPDIMTEFNVNAARMEFDKVREKYEGQITIKRGMELGNAQLDMQQADIVAQEFDGDFILGSVHNLEINHDVWYSDYRKINKKQFYHAYLDAVYEVAQKADYDVLAHITYPSKGIYTQTGWRLDLKEYQKQFEKIFEAVISRGKGIEVNTSGLRVSLQEALPNEEILKLYRDCGGTIITVGSDAHKAEDIGEGIKEAMQCLEKLKFEGITTYTHRIAEQHCFGT